MILRGKSNCYPTIVEKEILLLAHETHQGIAKTKQFLRSRFCWPGIDEAVETMIKYCHTCAELVVE